MIRFSVVGVAISVAERSFGNQAIGWPAATVVNGAKRSPITWRCWVALCPARAAMMLSKRG